MIVAKINRRKDLSYKLEVKGHANGGPNGQDLVCAGVSCVVTGAVNSMIEELVKTCDVGGHELIHESGNITFELLEPFRDKEKQDLLFKMLFTQLRTIEIQFQDFMTVSYINE